MDPPTIPGDFSPRCNSQASWQQTPGWNGFGKEELSAVFVEMRMEQRMVLGRFEDQFGIGTVALHYPQIVVDSPGDVFP